MIKQAIVALLFFYTTLIYCDDYNHDKWDIQPKDQVRTFIAFVSSFDGTDDSDLDGDTEKDDCYGQPEWVAYEIRKIDKVEKIKRPSSWTTDKELFKNGIAPDDKTYKHSGYDRGHLCMKHIASRLGAKADKETHTMINACPQIHKFNAGIWLHLEKKSADWADKYGKVWVMCGPIWEQDKDKKLIGDKGEMKIPVPHKFWKIIAWEEDSKLTVKSWIFPHEEIKKIDGEYKLDEYKTSVDKVEELTRLDFFTVLEDEQEEELEKTIH